MWRRIRKKMFVFEELIEEARSSCSPQGVMLDFMTVIVGVMQISLSVGVAIKWEWSYIYMLEKVS